MSENEIDPGEVEFLKLELYRVLMEQNPGDLEPYPNQDNPFLLTDTYVGIGIAVKGLASAAILALDQYRRERGMVVVPREPTPEMMKAGWSAGFDDPYDGSQAVLLGAVFDAMIAAAPEPFTADKIEGVTLEDVRAYAAPTPQDGESP